MTDEHALLTAIREHPDEDTPRLVYADWLDERPTPKRKARSELIRAQIAFARRPGYDLGPVTRGAPSADRSINLIASVGRVQKMSAEDAGWVRGYELEPDGSRREYEGPVSHFSIDTFERPNAPTNLTMFPLGPRPQYQALADRVTAILWKWGMAWMPKEGRIAHRAEAGVTTPVKLNVTNAIVNTGYGFDIDYTFDRGFIDRVRVQWPDEIEPDLARPAPIIGPRMHIKHIVGALAAHPVRHFTFRYANHEPAVEVEIVRDRVGWWCARLRADDDSNPQPNARFYSVETDTRTSRRELVQFLPTFLRRHLPQVRFRYVEPRIPF